MALTNEDMYQNRKRKNECIIDMMTLLLAKTRLGLGEDDYAFLSDSLAEIQQLEDDWYYENHQRHAAGTGAINYDICPHMMQVLIRRRERGVGM